MGITTSVSYLLVITSAFEGKRDIVICVCLNIS